MNEEEMTLEREEKLRASTRLLNEIDRYMQRYLSLTQAQRTAMLLYAAATHAAAELPAFPHMAWISEAPRCGKTTSMKVTAALSCNPQNAKTTTDGLMSLLVMVTKTNGVATLFYDEIGKFYGDMGNRQPVHILNDVALDGYQKGAQRTRSNRQAPEVASLYHPLLMTGRHVSMPDDVADRTIFIRPENGQGVRYYDARVAQPRAKRYGENLSMTVTDLLGEFEEFRAYGIHPRLTGRDLELWEPLFAAGVILGGQEWLNRCLEAFLELAVGQSRRRILSVREQMLKDLLDILDEGVLTWIPESGNGTDGGFLPGELAAAELKRSGVKLYKNTLLEALVQDVADTLDLPSHQVRGLRKRDDRYQYDRSRGYYVSDLREAWDEVQPADPEDVVVPEFDNPFALDDEEEFEDLTPDGTVAQGGTAARGGTGGTGFDQERTGRHERGKSRSTTGTGSISA